MKLAFVFGPRLVWGRPLDFTRIWDDPRGTTGSEIVVLAYAKEMAARGHQVTLFTPEPNASMWEGCTVEPQARLGDGSAFDTVFTSFGVETLKQISPKVLRIEDHQVNDLDYAGGFAEASEAVDLFLTPSKASREWMAQFGDTSGWQILPNGCYPEHYRPWRWTPKAQKIPGRCVYISAPDRGLHLLLRQWPTIKAAVPHATLKIFYYALEPFLQQYRKFSKDEARQLHPVYQDQYHRATYIDQVLPILKDHGVEFVGSVSRNQLARELSEAEALLYPCRPTRFTETFSCAVLEGCASGALPILSRADCLPEIYEEACPMVALPEGLETWTQLAILALKDQKWADGWREKGRALAAQHAWPILAERLENIIQKALSDGGSSVGPISSGADSSSQAERSIEPGIDFVCAEAWEHWDPVSAEEHGIGGSETAVIEMSKRLDKKVRVWSPTGKPEQVIDGVTYTGQPYPPKRLETDVLVAWRRADLLESCHAKKKLLWLHDACIPLATPGLVAQADKIVVLGQFHKKAILTAHPWLEESQLYVSRGGIDPERFKTPAPTRDPHRAVWMQSPERGLTELLQMWPGVLEKVPDANLHVLYGFQTWQARAEHYRNVDELWHIEKLLTLIRNSKQVTLHGRVSRSKYFEIIRSAGVWLYPSWHWNGQPFYEMCPVSSMEAQAAGLRMVISPRGGLFEYADADAYASIDGDPTTDEYRRQFIKSSVMAMQEQPADNKYALENFGWNAVADDWAKNLLC